MTHQTIRLGISTCPNDTFAFHGLMQKCVDWQGLNFEIELLDIQELNNSLFMNRFDIAKASFHAALLLAEQYIVLPSGSALGFGVGPLCFDFFFFFFLASDLFFLFLALFSKLTKNWHF